MAKFEWRHGFPKPKKVTAQVFGEAIAALDDGAGVRPKQIVDVARPRRAPLHPLFVWDNDRAGEAYREIQASGYLRSLTRVHVEEEQQHSREYLCVREAPKEPRQYIARDRVLSSDYMRTQVLSDMERDLRAYLSRYAGALAMSPARGHIDAALEAIGEELARLAHEARQPERRRRASADDVSVSVNA